MKRVINISICKIVLTILTMVLSANSYALTNLEAFEFNDEAGTSFSSFVKNKAGVIFRLTASESSARCV